MYIICAIITIPIGYVVSIFFWQPSGYILVDDREEPGSYRLETYLGTPAPSMDELKLTLLLSGSWAILSCPEPRTSRTGYS